MSNRRKKLKRKKEPLLEGELKRWIERIEAEAPPAKKRPPPEPEAPPVIEALAPRPLPRPRTPEEFRTYINIPEWRRQLVIHDMVTVEIAGRLLDAFEWALQELEIACADHVGGAPSKGPPK